MICWRLICLCQGQKTSPKVHWHCCTMSWNVHRNNESTWRALCKLWHQIKDSQEEVIREGVEPSQPTTLADSKTKLKSVRWAIPWPNFHLSCSWFKKIFLTLSENRKARTTTSASSDESINTSRSRRALMVFSHEIFTSCWTKKTSLFAWDELSWLEHFLMETRRSRFRPPKTHNH